MWRMPFIHVSVELEWQPIGQVRLDESGRPAFPKASLRPGLYSFQFDRAGDRTIYIGETDQLDRRFQHYRTPGPSQRTNLRPHALICETLKTGGAVSVSTATSGTIKMKEGGERPADLAQKSERVLLEHAALCVAKVSAINVLNL